MKRSFLLVLAILAIGFLPLFGQQNVPAIVFDGDTRDFGKVSEGDELKQLFRFTNKGQGQLDILNVQPG